MSLLKNTRLFSIAGCLVCLLIVNNSILTAKLNFLQGSSDVSVNDHPKGYNDVVCFREKFVAVGTGGRIDCITPSGEKIPLDTSCRYDLNCAYANEKILLAAGNRGTILFSSDGIKFHSAASITKTNIHTITFRSGVFIAGADSGIILSSIDGISWKNVQIKARGNIVSLSANNSLFIGVTDTGEIIKSTDGMKWDIQDYNKEYAGYNPYSKFKKILAGPNNIVIIGKHSDGSPSILFSTLGNVWTERQPIYQDEQGIFRDLSSMPNGITYDADRDQFVVACDNGELLVLPPCEHCNRWAKISDANLYAIIYHENRFLIAGEKYCLLIQRLL